MDHEHLETPPDDDWPDEDDDEADPEAADEADEEFPWHWGDQEWTAESRCPECEYTTGDAPGCLNE